MHSFQKLLMTSAVVLIGLAAVDCKKPPKSALSEAEDAVADARAKSECAKEKFDAAEKLLEEAKELSAQKKYDEAERKARAAKKLADKAKKLAEKNWDDCQERLAGGDESDQEESGASEKSKGPSSKPSADLDAVYFGYDSSELSSEAREQLEENVRWLKQHPDKRVILEGHTDARGSIEYNLALGERRAKSVKQYLIQLGISGERLNVLSYGEEKPAAYGDSKSAYRKNRRVEFRPQD